jgi:hypothetical protein
MRVILALPPFPPTILTSYAEIMGWMGKKSAEPNLGIITVAALLPRDWHIQVVDPARLPNFVAARPMPDIAREMTNFFRTAYAPEFVLDRAFGQAAALGRDFPGKIARRPRPFEWRLILEVLVRRGWLAPSRQKFWKYVLLGLRRFPARLFYFFSYLAIAEHHFEFRDHVLREVAADLNRWQSQVPVASDQ